MSRASIEQRILNDGSWPVKRLQVVKTFRMLRSESLISHNLKKCLVHLDVKSFET